MAIKPILPSMREKKRYIAYEAIARDGSALRLDEVKAELSAAMLRFIGEKGFSAAGLIVLDDWHGSRGVIKVSHDYTDEAKAAMAMVTRIASKAAVIRALGTSGILKKARKGIGG